MKCSSCGAADDKVLESRSVRGGVAIRRRRVCLQCGRRFTTYEEVLRDFLMVVKNDGKLEEFSRQKLAEGIISACRKPISLDGTSNSKSFSIPSTMPSTSFSI